MLHAAPSEPALTVHDIGHDPDAAREQNATRVLAALPGTASSLSRSTGLSHIAVAAAVALLLGRGQAQYAGPFNYEKA